MLHEPPPRPSARKAGADYVVPQCWDAFTDDDHAVWDLLFARQVELLGTRVVTPFLDGIDLLRLSHPGVPDLAELNAILEPRTGWRTVAVTGPGAGRHLLRHARASACSRSAISSASAKQLDYLEEPDCFHDLFGHIPMLANHDFAEMTRACRRARRRGDRRRRGRARRADLLAQRRIRAGARRRRAQDPRRRARLELRRSPFQPGERHGRTRCPSRSRARSARPIATMSSSRATWCPNCWNRRSTTSSPQPEEFSPRRLRAGARLRRCSLAFGGAHGSHGRPDDQANIAPGTTRGRCATRSAASPPG